LKMNINSVRHRLLRLFIGIMVITGLFLLAAYSSPPPDFAGEVVRHNILMEIDASPLFYSEVENFTELEHGLKMQINNYNK